MASNEQLIDRLRKRAREITKEMARSTIGFKDKARLEGELNAINDTLATLASGNGSNQNG